MPYKRQIIYPDSTEPSGYAREEASRTFWDAARTMHTVLRSPVWLKENSRGESERDKKLDAARRKWLRDLNPVDTQVDSEEVRTLSRIFLMKMQPPGKTREERESYRVTRLADAEHAATAVLAGATMFVTHNRTDFDEGSPLGKAIREALKGRKPVLTFNSYLPSDALDEAMKNPPPKNKKSAEKELEKDLREVMIHKHYRSCRMIGMTRKEALRCLKVLGEA